MPRVLDELTGFDMGIWLCPYEHERSVLPDRSIN